MLFDIYKPSPLTGKSLFREMMEAIMDNFPSGVAELLDSERKLLAQGRWHQRGFTDVEGLRVETTPMRFYQDGVPDGIELCDDHGAWVCYTRLVESGHGALIVPYTKGDEFEGLELMLTIG